MDWGFVHRIWDKWASNYVGSSEQEGIQADPIELSQFVGYVKRNKLRTESFFFGLNQYLVTSIHESWFGARCIQNLLVKVLLCCRRQHSS